MEPQRSHDFDQSETHIEYGRNIEKSLWTRDIYMSFKEAGNFSWKATDSMCLLTDVELFSRQLFKRNIL